MPRSGAITARLPRSSRVPRAASHPSTGARLYGSRWSNPFVTSANRAVSRTERDTQPRTAVTDPSSIFGLFGIRPYVHFSPNKPVNPAGMRNDPPPSPPVPTVTSPPATPRRPPTRPPAGRTCQIPGVTGHAVEVRAREVHAAELTRRRQTDQHRARVAQPSNERGVVRRHLVLQRHARLGVRPAGDG